VHALVAAVLLGPARRDALEADAETKPPDREPREAVEAAAGEGNAVSPEANLRFDVGADRDGQAALLDRR
jgi:hypothetical protein